MRCHFFDDRRPFAERVRPFLARRPIEHNLLSTLLAREVAGDTPLLALVDDGEIVAVAISTPPRPLVVSVSSPEALEVLAGDLSASRGALPGVTGPSDAAAAFAAAWRRFTGCEVRKTLSMAMLSLRRVTPPARMAAGALRAATAADRDQLVRWAAAFGEELGERDATPELTVDRQLALGGLFVWDDGRPVSVLATSAPVDGVTRIFLVYTPPPLRGNGYASAAVAAASEAALTTPESRCMLYVDLANPTSNAIYRQLGYRTLAAAATYRFTTP